MMHVVFMHTNARTPYNALQPLSEFSLWCKTCIQGIFTFKYISTVAGVTLAAMQDTGRFTLTGKSVGSISEVWQGLTTCESLTYKSGCKSAAKDACDCDPGEGTQNAGGMSDGLRTAIVAGVGAGVGILCTLAVIKILTNANMKKHPKKVQQLGSSFSKSARRFAKDASTRATLVWNRMPGSIKEMHPYSMYAEDNNQDQGLGSRLPSNVTIPFTTNAQGAPDNTDAMSAYSINTAHPPISRLSSAADSVASGNHAHDLHGFPDGNAHAPSSAHTHAHNHIQPFV
jgi:hypothetical protein